MLLENKRIAIVGGGPGGLTLARLLQLKGVEVKVYERDLNREVRVQGATLDLHFESGLKAIEQAGLMDAFKEHYRPGADKGRVIDQQGKMVYDQHTEETHDDFNDEQFRPEIDRGPLRDLLLDALQPGTVVWDSQFKSMSQTDGVWTLAFKNGTTATADIVIGADGGNSKIRPFVTPVQNVYAGIVIVQGNVPDSEHSVPQMHELLKGGKIYSFDGSKYIHLSSKGDGSIDFYISSKRDEGWMKNSGIDFSEKTSAVEWLKKEFSGWDSSWLAFFEKIELPLLLRPQYCMPFDQTWEALPNLTLLGDAAHLMPPSGEGVNLAMLDALELSGYLTSDTFSTVQASIAAYEKPMRERGSKEAEVSMELVEWMHAEGAQDKLVELFFQIEEEGK